MALIKVWGDVPDWTYGSVQSILETLRQSDDLTYKHCLRVGAFARRLARDAGLNEYQQTKAEFVGLLHDVGKMGVDRYILNKPSKLTPEEMEKMRDHALLSEQIVKPLQFESIFAQILPSIRGHHERIDGLGYPDKLEGDQIPLLARIVLIVDTLDAMSEDRPYRKGLPLQAIYGELKKYAGVQFDPQLVKIFLDAHPHWAKDHPNHEVTLSGLKIAA